MAQERHTPQAIRASRADELGGTEALVRRQLPQAGVKSAALLAVAILLGCLLLSSCRAWRGDGRPFIIFSQIPPEDPGGTPKSAIIAGRVSGARPDQQIVLFARSGAWFVQPFVDQPFTRIEPDSKWQNSTHLGTEYAALLVEADYQPPASTYELPGEGNGVVAVAIVKGVPVFWKTEWFQVTCVVAGLLAIFAFYRYRLHQLTKQLQVRFEERLAERTRIAQELHDTLLQGFLSASMQLHVTVDRLPADSPEKPRLSHILQLMGQVIEEGRTAVRGLRSSTGSDSLDLGQAFSRIPQELALVEPARFRVLVEGHARPLHPILRDEVYRIGREAVVNAFRHAQAKSIEVEVDYMARSLRLLVRDDGCGIDPAVLQTGRDGHWGLSGMRERAERIGARFKVRSRATSGTEVELSVPGAIAYQNPTSRQPLRWLPGFRRHKQQP